MNSFGKTDIGLRRSSNQDAFASHILSDHALWAVVCDGMGGVNGGNVASAIAVELVTEQMDNGLREDMSASSVQRLLSTTIENANMAIYRRAQEEPELAGMGTTIVLAAILRGKAYVSHVGDSRAYLISKNECSQITIDHSMVQMMVDMGTLTEDEAKVHPNKNVITRALGIEPNVQIDYKDYTHAEDEILLLCSDGLTNFVGPDMIAKLTLENKLRNVPDVLVEQANRNGGGDNITVVVIGKE